MFRQCGLLAPLAMVFASPPLLAQADRLSFDFSPIDRAAPPCLDFYQHACGTWLTSAKIPPGWDQWMDLAGQGQRTADAQRQIVEAAEKADPGRDALTQKIGDYYAACMDTKTIESKGSAPLQPELERIRAIRSVRGLMEEAARLVPLQLNLLFNVGTARDDAGVYVLQLEPPSGGTITLGPGSGGEAPSKEPENGKKEQSDQAIQVFSTTVLQLAGLDYAGAQSAMKVLDSVPEPLGNADLKKGTEDQWMTLAAADRAMPNLHLRALYEAYGIPSSARVRIRATKYFQELNRQLVRVPLPFWKAALTLSYVATLAFQPLRVLPQAFADAKSHLQRDLGETPPKTPRKDLCLSSLKQDLGEALGRKYAERELTPETKRRVEEMISNMRAAMQDRIEGSAWMSAESKRRALEKLAAMHVGVGYPEVWRDYSRLLVDRGDVLGNRWRAAQFETARWMGRIGRPPDHRQWEGTPVTDNLYYLANLNAVELPACELVAAFEPGKPDAFNYGALGGGIGHEISHAFDDSGRKYDAQGMPRESWTTQDVQNYGNRAQCFVAQYSAATVLDGLHIDGKRTLDENLADNVGILVAYGGLAKALAKRGQRIDDPAAGDGGYTPAQLFYLGWAIARCVKMTPDALRAQTNTDTHSPERVRVNLPVANSPAFRQAFSCQAGTPMAPAPACSVW